MDRESSRPQSGPSRPSRPSSSPPSPTLTPPSEPSNLSGRPSKLNLRVSDDSDPPSYSEAGASGSGYMDVDTTPSGKGGKMGDYRDATPPRRGPARVESRDPSRDFDREVDGFIDEEMRDSHDETPFRTPYGSVRRRDISRDRASIATVEQKQAMWWRNVLITAMFIASWWVDETCFPFSHTHKHTSRGVRRDVITW